MYVAISYICAPCAFYSLLVRYASVSYAFLVRSMWLVRCASVSYKFGIRWAFVEHSSSMRSMRSTNVAHSYCYNFIMPYSLSIRYSSVAYALCKLKMRWQIDSFTVILERIRNGLRIFAISLCVSHQLGPGTHMWPWLMKDYTSHLRLRNQQQSTRLSLGLTFDIETHFTLITVCHQIFFFSSYIDVQYMAGACLADN